MSAAASVAVFSLIQGCLVATPLGDLDREGVRQFQAQLSARLQHERVRGVVLDVSALEVMDEHDFAWVSDTLKLADLMGPRAVLAALSPCVVATLIQLRVPLEGVRAALTVDQAVQMLLNPGPVSAR